MSKTVTCCLVFSVLFAYPVFVFNLFGNMCVFHFCWFH